MKWVCRLALVLGDSSLLFIAALGFGIPTAWEIAFGVAYCLDGYPPCGKSPMSRCLILRLPDR